MSLLHPEVAARKFPALVNELRLATKVEALGLRFQEAAFPFIQFQVLDATSQPCIGLFIDARNYPHRGLRIVPYDLSFRKALVREQIPAVADGDGRVHVMTTQDQTSWFCVIGTDQYHSFYADAVPWESVRALPSAGPGQILLACVACIDRNKLVPMTEPGLPFPYDPPRKAV